MKSGLYITEIVKRLFRSEEMKKIYPDGNERIRHILDHQVYGLAPARIIYRTAVNYIFGLNDLFITQPFGLNLGTLLPGPLTFRWYFQYLDFSNAGTEMLGLLERVSPYFVTTAQAFLVTGVEAAVFLALIALVYRRQGV